MAKVEVTKHTNKERKGVALLHSYYGVLYHRAFVCVCIGSLIHLFFFFFNSGVALCAMLHFLFFNIVSVFLLFLLRATAKVNPSECVRVRASVCVCVCTVQAFVYIF